MLTPLIKNEANGCTLFLNKDAEKFVVMDTRGQIIFSSANLSKAQAFLDKYKPC